MYFHSGVKKVTLVLFLEVSGDESFCKEQFILRNQKELGRKRGWSCFPSGEENSWNFCLYQLSFTGHIAGTVCALWFHVVPALCRNQIQRKTQWRNNASKMTTTDLSLSLIQTCGIEKSRVLSDLKNWSFHRDQWAPLWYLWCTSSQCPFGCSQLWGQIPAWLFSPWCSV